MFTTILQVGQGKEGTYQCKLHACLQKFTHTLAFVFGHLTIKEKNDIFVRP